MSLDHWRTVMDVNVTSAFLVTREVMASMPDGGRVVMLGSIVGETGGSTGSAAYAASKTALEGLTRGLAPRGTTVNLVAPGYITDTPFHETFSTPAKRAATVEGIPLGRAGHTDDVAAAVRWLVSPAASFVTGTMTHVNGGAWF